MSVLIRGSVTFPLMEQSFMFLTFNLDAEHIMQNAGLMKHKLESTLPGEISVTSDTQMTPPL